MTDAHATAAANRIRARAWLPVGLFFLSGAVGLAYEVAWSRLLALQVGGSAFALSAILTVFLGGLGAGAWIGGRRAARLASPLRACGLLEIAIGVLALSIPLAMRALGPFARFAYRHLADTPGAFELAQLAACGAILVVPTMLLGATLPLMTQHASRSGAGHGRLVGFVYGANTAGACIGALLTGFVLLPDLGLARTQLVAAATSIAIGVGLLLLARCDVRVEVPPEASPAPASGADPAPAPSPGPLLAALALAGFAAMTCQVAWTRAITLAIGPTAHAFALVAGAFILGLAVGAPILGSLADRIGRRGGLVVACLLATSAAIALSIRPMGDLAATVVLSLARHGERFWRVQAAQLAAVIVAILAPTFLMGGTLPAACRALAGGGPDIARSVGRGIAWNTVGTVAGAFMAGFVVLPQVGIRQALVVASGACALASIVAAAGLRGGTSPASRAIVAVLVAGSSLGSVGLALASDPWDLRVMTSAPYLDPPALSPGGMNQDLARQLLQQRPLPIHHAEDAVTTVTVTESAGGRALWTAGEVAGVEWTSENALLAHVPLLTHPQPRSVLVIGLGAGSTLVSVLSHEGVERVDCVEISPAVRDAMESHFQLESKPLADTRVRLRIGDGRAHVESTDARYDVILSQPGNPWMAGSAALYTREGFEAMRDRLEPGGVVGAWLQGWMPMPAVQSLLATFTGVFPHVDLWETGSVGHYLIVGSMDPLRFVHPSVTARLASPRLELELARLRIAGVGDVLCYHLLDQRGAAHVAGSAKPSTDDLDRIGVPTARALGANAWIEVGMALESARTPAIDRVTGLTDGETTALAARLDRVGRARALMMQANLASTEALAANERNDPDASHARFEEAMRLLAEARAIVQDDPCFAGLPWP